MSIENNLYSPVDEAIYSWNLCLFPKIIILYIEKLKLSWIEQYIESQWNFETNSVLNRAETAPQPTIELLFHQWDSLSLINVCLSSKW